MRVFRVAAMVAAAVVLLVGCAAPQIPYDRSPAAPVTTVGIVSPSFPDRPSVILASSVGQSFGLIGALIDAGMQGNRDARFAEAAQQQGFSVSQEFLDSLAEELRAQGYAVAVVPVTRDGSDFLSKYPNTTEAPIDAWLDLVSPAYGYIAAGIGSSTPYRPQFAVRARLVSARDASVLMQDAVAYNPVGPVRNTVTIAPDADFQFTDFDMLMADPAAAIEGLRHATQQSAKTLGKLLR